MGTAERKLREKEQKKNLFLDCAEQLFFSKGFKETTIDDIVECAEYSKGTLYLYFKSKEEMLGHINLRAVNTMFGMFKDYSLKAKNGLEKLYAIGNANFDFMEEYSKYFEIMELYESKELDHTNLEEVDAELQYVNAKVFELLIQAFYIGKEDGSIREDVNPEMHAYLLASTSKGVFNFINKCEIGNWNLPGYSKEEMFKAYFQLIENAIKK